MWVRLVGALTGAAAAVVAFARAAPGLVRLYVERRRLQRRQFEDLLRRAGVPARVSWRDRAARRARRATRRQIRALVKTGRVGLLSETDAASPEAPPLRTELRHYDGPGGGPGQATHSYPSAARVEEHGSPDATPQLAVSRVATGPRAPRERLQTPGEGALKLVEGLAAPGTRRREARTEARTETLVVTQDEALLAAALVGTDAALDAALDAGSGGATGILPRPRGSETAKVDTQVKGYWERNPNAAPEVQTATTLPIVHTQIRTIIEHLLAAKPQVQGPPALVDEVRRWFEVEMELSTGHERGLTRFITDMAKQLLYYGSCAVIRQRTLSTEVAPFNHPVTRRKTPPVWGYAIPDMATLEVFLDAYGRPRRWRQHPSLFSKDNPKSYRADDVFLARLPTHNSSLYFWTPTFILPSLYAINVLKELHRIIEAHTDAIVNIPYYATVGDKDFLTGTVSQTMIDDVKAIIDLTPRSGTPVVPWHVRFNRIEVDQYLEQLLKAAEFWGQEVRRGIGGSMLSDGVGDSSTRNTSDALMEREMRAAAALIPEIQIAFRWLVTEKLFERGLRPDQIRSQRDLPQLVFSEIDLAEQIRRETHATNLWLSGGLKHGEFRAEIGRDEDPARTDVYWFDIQKEVQMEQAEQAARLKAQMNPSNQHGTQTKPKKRSNA